SREAFGIDCSAGLGRGNDPLLTTQAPPRPPPTTPTQKAIVHSCALPLAKRAGSHGEKVVRFAINQIERVAVPST
ncbi:MAG TPA: hypothetical protein VK638_01270, partial [Edaphobacter sp.]|nr:hypothetical protein [Edaphobacter sp.]